MRRIYTPNPITIESMLADLRAVENVGSKNIFATGDKCGTFVPAFVAKQQCGTSYGRDDTFGFALRFPLAVVVSKRGCAAVEVTVKVDQIGQFADLAFVVGY